MIHDIVSEKCYEVMIILNCLFASHEILEEGCEVERTRALFLKDIHLHGNLKACSLCHRVFRLHEVVIT